ncbi:MAG: NADH-quinone oxidoreductase subunit A [Dehalococcoidales bacterium]|nr:NADH-quinone oxidoreductase subunit A [Dehalococcoidales bacterium]
MSQEYLTAYFLVAVFLFAGAVLVVGGLIASRLLAPRGNKRGAKLNAYESGMEAVGNAQVQFPIRYYTFALLFVLFDVEAIFLLAWAALFRNLGAAGLVEMAVFIGVLVVGLVYAWRKGALEWT